MRAIVHTRYGPPEVVQLKEIPDPLPGENELRIKVYASTVNRTDSGFRSAEYVVSRLFSGLFAPKQQTLGSEYAGIVDRVGGKVSKFREGDKVFGFNDQRFGGHAEYVLVSENDNLAILPAHLDFATGAALLEGSHYALCNIRASGIKAGQKAMVYGATGAIGSAAVQLLKAMDVTVTAVCNTKNVELVKSLGADTVIDYQTEDFRACGQQFPLVLDAVGKSSFGACRPLLEPTGVYISTELGKNGENVWRGMVASLIKGKRVLFPLPTINLKDVHYIRSLAENGKFRPVLDRTYPMHQIVEAYRYVETGQKTGNVILQIREEGL